MSDIVTTDTGDAAAADADKPRDDTDVLFRDDVDDADDLPTRASRRIVTAWTVVFAALVIAGAGFVAGIQMEKHNEPATTGLPAGFAAFANGAATAVRAVASPARMARPVASPARTVLAARRPAARRPVPQARRRRRRATARPVRSSSSTARTSTSRRATARR